MAKNGSSSISGGINGIGVAAAAAGDMWRISISRMA
jgi:hypothetical protein